MFKNELYAEESVFINASGAATDTAVVGAPSSNQFIVIDSYVISAAGVGNAWFESGGSTQISARHEFVAGSNAVVPHCRIKCAKGASLTYTSVGAGISTQGVQVNYHIEGV